MIEPQFLKSYGRWHDILMPIAERHDRDTDTDVSVDKLKEKCNKEIIKTYNKYLF